MVVDGCVMLVAERNFVCQTSSRLETSEAVLCPPLLGTTDKSMFGFAERKDTLFGFQVEDLCCGGHSWGGAVPFLMCEQHQFPNSGARAWSPGLGGRCTNSGGIIKEIRVDEGSACSTQSTACLATSKRPCLVEHRSLAREEDAEVCFSHEHEHAGEESTHKQKRCELTEDSSTSNYPSKNEETSVWDTFGALPHFRRQARIEKWPLSLRRTLLSDQHSCCSVTAKSSQSLPLLLRIVDLWLDLLRMLVAPLVTRVALVVACAFVAWWRRPPQEKGLGYVSLWRTFCDGQFQLAHWRVVAQTEGLCSLVRKYDDLRPCPFRYFGTSAIVATNWCNQKIMTVQRLSWRLPCAACLFHDLEKMRFLARATLLYGVWGWVLVSRHALVVRSEHTADCEIVAQSRKSIWYLLTSGTSLIWRLVGSPSLTAK